MRDLIERLEKVTEGSRELDAAIAMRIGIFPSVRSGLVTADAYARAWAGNYTTSLDAAQTLVPEGWTVSHAWWNDTAASFVLRRNQGEWPQGNAATPALALCIASLLARAAQQPQQGGGDVG